MPDPAKSGFFYSLIMIVIREATAYDMPEMRQVSIVTYQHALGIEYPRKYDNIV